jgi:glyoxylate reductase
MKRTAILINTSRGEIIDETALIRTLRNKKLLAVGLDVFENEPRINPKLLKFQNVIVIPHLGSATHEARDGMAILAVKNVINVLKSKPSLTPVF